MNTSTRFVVIASVAASALLPMVVNADIVYSLDCNTLTVAASAHEVGKRLKLLWDSTDKGDVDADWSNSAVIAEAVPSVGGTYTVDLAALGITNGTPCRLASYSCFARLNMLKQSSWDCYFDSGLTDTEVYGVRFGFYSVAKVAKSGKSADANWATCIGSWGSNGGFVVSANNTTRVTVGWRWRGVDMEERPSVHYGASATEAPDASKLDEFAFTNGVFTLNGETVKSGLEVGASCGLNGVKMIIGTSYNNIGAKSLYGFWSHVSFDGADGSKIRDYIPAQRIQDDAVGFLDRVTGQFHVSEGTAAFTAVAQTGETVYGDFRVESPTITPIGLSEHRSVLTVSVPPYLVGERLVILWDKTDKGSDLSAWANSEVITESAVGTHTVYMSSLGIRNGQVCRVVAGRTYYPLDMLKQDSYLSYVKTNIRDTDVYGVRFGYYSIAKKANDAPCIGSVGTSNGGFLVLSDGSSRITNGVVWRGDWWSEKPTVKYGTSDAPDTAKINEFALTNGVCTIDGVIIKSGLETGLSVGANGVRMDIGTAYNYQNSNAMYGWWSHVSFDDASGNKILDYIPVKRASDNAVGFWDRVIKQFVVSSGTGGFSAGSVKDEPPIFFVTAAQSFTVKSMPGTMIVIR